MLARLPRKKLVQLLLLLSIIAIALLASGLSNVNLKPGHSIAIGTTEEAGVAADSTVTIPSQTVVALVIGSLFFIWLIAIIIRFLQGKEAIREELLAWFFFALFVLVFTLVLSDAVSTVSPSDIPQGETLTQSLDFSEFIEETESSPVPGTLEPSNSFATIIGILIGLVMLGIGYWVYRRYFYKPAAATLNQLALDAEATLLKLQAEDANLRDVVLRAYYDMNKTVSEHGVSRTEGMTPREFEERLISAGLPRRDVERLTRLFEEVRYGHLAAGERQKREAIACMQAIVAAAQRRASTVTSQSSPIASNHPA